MVVERMVLGERRVESRSSGRSDVEVERSEDDGSVLGCAGFVEGRDGRCESRSCQNQPMVAAGETTGAQASDYM